MKTILQITFALVAFTFLLFTPMSAQNTKVKGVVQSIENGKDGYTAEIKTKDKKTYFVTISIANMDKGEDYHRFDVGDTAEVEGEGWAMGKQQRITVRKIYLDQDNDNFTTKGKVASIENGDDGYTAKIITKNKTTYFVTISIPNLDDHTQYRRPQIGETIEVTGELWSMDNTNRITVRKLKP